MKPWMRRTWTAEEVRQAEGVFPLEDVPEAMELFGPHDWETLYECFFENAPGEAAGMLLEERDKLRFKRARALAWSEADFFPGDDHDGEDMPW